ncbi:MAG TPA: TldD/PmbA family protein [Candidatus Cloacimonadota bacterium]|nr:TldD/PmbA family protein [Candidatus Cloacimonadota bacterium]
MDNLCKKLIDRLLELGADKAVVSYNESEDSEYNLIYKELNLLRSLESKRLNLAAYKDNKRAIKSINQIDEASVEEALTELIQSVQEGNPDPAFDIAEYQEPAAFTDGPLKPDNDQIVKRLQEFSQEMKSQYPCVHFDASMSHTHSKTRLINSNGLDVTMERGYYEFSTVFTAKKDGKMSSMNYTYFQTANLDKPCLDYNQGRELIRQIVEQTHPGSIPQKFVGDVILAPMVMGGLVYTLIQSHFTDGTLISKLSLFPDHLGQKLFSDKLTIKSIPRDPRLAMKYFITADGYLAQEQAIIENGVLKTYPVNIFGANKTGKPVAKCHTDNLVIEPGEKSLAEIIAGTKEGILCMRASYGSPSPQGDMSTVAKNSYYIKDGKIICPVKETMISFNLIEAMNNIEEFSSENHNLGEMIMPYTRISGVTVTGK